MISTAAVVMLLSKLKIRGVRQQQSATAEYNVPEHRYDVYLLRIVPRTYEQRNGIELVAPRRTGNPFLCSPVGPPPQADSCLSWGLLDVLLTR